MTSHQADVADEIGLPPQRLVILIITNLAIYINDFRHLSVTGMYTGIMYSYSHSHACSQVCADATEALGDRASFLPQAAQGED